ncbi:hypothetical protein HDV05_003860 [Chytridiales sp. JEL 0842]|nr:hypothetical protein HDV05_003860 [Chytridiales sp. JEL 0842]
MDKRYQLIKDMLYKQPATQPDTIQESESDHEKKEIVERIWSLLKSREAKAQEESLMNKYKSMRMAMEELEKTDKRLFIGTGVTNAEQARQKDESATEHSFIAFPRRMRVPTETPPLAGWAASRESS